MVLYELASETGMFLYRKEDLDLLEAPSVEIDTDDSLDLNLIAKKLQEEPLKIVCRIEGKRLILTRAPDPKLLQNLIGVCKDDRWQRAVLECIGKLPREMDALGLRNIDYIRPKPRKGQPLSRSDLYKVKCTDADLENTALERGRPFDLFSALPAFIVEKVEKEFMPRVEAEVGARLYPQIIQLTLRVLALLSLIGVAVALAAKYFDVKLTWLGVVAVLAISAMLVVLVCIFGKFPQVKSEREGKVHSGKSPLSAENVEIEKEYRFPKFVSFVLKKLEKKNQERN